MGVLLGVGAEGEVGDRHLVRLALAAGLLPGLVQRLRVLGELVRAGAALDPAVPVLGRPLE